MASSHAESELQNGKNSFKSAIDTASTAASNIGGEVRKGAQQVGEAVRGMSGEAARQISDAGSEAFDRLGEKAKQATELLDEEIKKSPFMALGMAFGLGILMAGLFRRS